MAGSAMTSEPPSPPATTSRRNEARRICSPRATMGSPTNNHPSAKNAEPQIPQKDTVFGPLTMTQKIIPETNHIIPNALNEQANRVENDMRIRSLAGGVSDGGLRHSERLSSEISIS